MKLSIIIPIFNEKSTILEVLNRINNVKLDYNLTKEIIIVDDNSNDGTAELINSISNIELKKILHQSNIGKGGTINTGIRNATGDLIIIQDADLEYNPEDYNCLLKQIIENQAQVVYGSRFLDKNNLKNWSLINKLANKFLTFLTNLLFNSNLTDMETCYKVLSKEVLNRILPIKSKRFEVEPEITAKLLKNKIKIFEVPINYYPRKTSEGKHIAWPDFFIAINELIKQKYFLK